MYYLDVPGSWDQWLVNGLFHLLKMGYSLGLYATDPNHLLSSNGVWMKCNSYAARSHGEAPVAAPVPSHPRAQIPEKYWKISDENKFPNSGS